MRRYVTPGVVQWLSDSTLRYAQQWLRCVSAVRGDENAAAGLEAPIAMGKCPQARLLSAMLSAMPDVWSAAVLAVMARGSAPPVLRRICSFLPANGSALRLHVRLNRSLAAVRCAAGGHRKRPLPHWISLPPTGGTTPRHITSMFDWIGRRGSDNLSLLKGGWSSDVCNVCCHFLAWMFEFFFLYKKIR